MKLIRDKMSPSLQDDLDWNDTWHWSHHHVLKCNAIDWLGLGQNNKFCNVIFSKKIYITH